VTHPEVFAAIESEISRIEGYLATLREKVHALRATTASAPGEIQGSVSEPCIPVYLTSRGAVHPSGFWLAGEFHPCSSQIGIYIGLLRAMAQHSEDALPRAAGALRELGHSRCYLATERRQLFPSQPEEWARAHSRRVAEGWYADTNLNLELKQRLIRRILRANGLREGLDVVIFWRNTRAGTVTDVPTDQRRISQHH
jgi:hypothetical protein